MEDIRLYKDSMRFDYTYTTRDTSEQMDGSHVPEDKATSIEVIAGKVVKFMLTSKGSDLYNPEYGGVSMHHVQISQAYIPQLIFEIRSDLEACIAFIKDADNEHSIEKERLLTVNLLDVKYNPRTLPTRLDVYIEVVTTFGNKAMVAITPQTSGVD